MTPDPAPVQLVFDPHVAIAMSAIGMALVAALVAWLLGLDERGRPPGQTTKTRRARRND